MQINDIDHIEFYVGDAQQSAFYWCTAFGFQLCGQAGPETGLADQRSLLLRQGDARFLLTSGLTPAHPAARYVAKHGDGVANIAFATPDAGRAFEEAVARGARAVEPLSTAADDEARVVTATVGGFGDVHHRLVERHGSERAFLPGVMDILTSEPEPREQHFSLVDHAAVCLPTGDLGRTVKYYRDVFGFSQIFEEFIEVGAQAMDSKVVQNDAGTVTFTLIEPAPGYRPGQIDRFLEQHQGAGVQHLALLTGDIVAAVSDLDVRGVQFLSTPASYYHSIEERLGRTDVPIERLRATNVLVDRDHWGELFQIFTKPVHVRGTYFTELVDRHGARSFGSSNIKALYEAVAQDTEVSA
ncbi:4-hydroxyphenylpyruvate dioxygenase [Micromonospora sp. NPDC005215]|uniref:4-hydroxyphenylpyruvate dioxygenase n=1 Tax=Micromonospora sp. NPDC005215 TaxID=3157024 RepID=UPI0033B576E9